jgi:hypothetical protein
VRPRMAVVFLVWAVWMDGRRTLEDLCLDLGRAEEMVEQYRRLPGTLFVSVEMRVAR